MNSATLPRFDPATTWLALHEAGNPVRRIARVVNKTPKEVIQGIARARRMRYRDRVKDT